MQSECAAVQLRARVLVWGASGEYSKPTLPCAVQMKTSQKSEAAFEDSKYSLPEDSTTPNLRALDSAQQLGSGVLHAGCLRATCSSFSWADLHLYPCRVSAHVQLAANTRMAWHFYRRGGFWVGTP